MNGWHVTKFIMLITNNSTDVYISQYVSIDIQYRITLYRIDTYVVTSQFISMYDMSSSIMLNAIAIIAHTNYYFSRCFATRPHSTLRIVWHKNRYWLIIHKFFITTTWIVTWSPTFLLISEVCIRVIIPCCQPSRKSLKYSAIGLFESGGNSLLPVHVSFNI